MSESNAAVYQGVDDACGGPGLCGQVQACVV
jgi:hypothetical protein